MSVFAQSLSLDMNSYISRVKADNLDIKAASFAVNKADAQVKEALSAVLPSLAVQGAYKYDNDLNSTTPGVVGASNPYGANPQRGAVFPAVSGPLDTNYTHQLSAGAGVEENLDPSAFASYKQAKTGRALEGAAFQATLDSVITGAKKLYMGVLLEKEAAETKQRSSDVSKDAYDSIVRKEKAGAATELDMMQAEVDWRNKAAEAQAAEQNYEQALLQLKDLACIPFSTTVYFSDENSLGGVAKNRTQAPEEPDLTGVLEKNPDYKVEALRSELAAEQQKAALEAFIPKVSLAVNYGYADLQGLGNDKSLNHDSQWLKDQQQFTAGVTVTIPLEEGGYRAAKIKEADAAKKQADANLENKERAVRLQLEQTREKLKADITQVNNYILIQDTAQRGLETAQSAFRNGAITRLDLADARDEAEETRLGYENAVYNLASDWFDWEQITGEMKSE
jgi:outer membrane protein TolC